MRGIRPVLYGTVHYKQCNLINAVATLNAAVRTLGLTSSHISCFFNEFE